MQQQQTANKPSQKILFLLLINTKSGGGWGKCYIQLKKQQFTFEYKQNKSITVKLVDLFNLQKKQQQLKSIKNFQNKQKNIDIRIIICGGDGTIFWGIQQCVKAQLNLPKIKFGCLPIGTGNDFSRTIGWGSHPLKFSDNNIVPLKKRVIQWINSTIVNYDIWEVQITTYEKGFISIVKNKQDFPLQNKLIKRGFVNYVGIGIDARVSYHFQKHRKSTKLMNIAVYGCFGLLFCCKKSRQLNSLFESFTQIKQQMRQSGAPKQSPIRIIHQNISLDNSMYEQLNKNSQSINEQNNINLKPGYHGLTCLNSISYMAGSMNVWDTNSLGIKDGQHNVKNFKIQQINDGKLQFVGFKNQLRLVIQRVIHSGAKVAQGQGPFSIKFKKQHQLEDTFIQIDGQGLKIRGIKQVIIRKYDKIQSGSINVMMKNVNFGKN